MTARTTSLLLLLVATPEFQPGILLGSDSNLSTNQVTIRQTNSVQNAEDQFRLGRAYARGEGVDQSYEQAGFWYRKAADQGNLKAMHNLGVLYLQGQGTPKDEKEGFRLIKRAAEGGDRLSKGLCGSLYLNGIGVSKNPASGIGWLRKAADSGNADDLAALGKALLANPGISEQAGLKALDVIRQSARKGNAWAIGEMGEFYLAGKGVPKDEGKANELFTEGARRGDPASQFHLAALLMKQGKYLEAFPWALLSVKGHYIRSIGLLQEIKNCLIREGISFGEGEIQASLIERDYALHSGPCKMDL